MMHRIAAGWMAAALALGAGSLAACGGDDVTVDEARRIVINGLIEAGQPPAVAACVAAAALAEHAPGDLVNEAGTTSAEVNASVAGMVAECTTALAPPPPPTLAVPVTSTTTPSPPTTIAVALSPALCATAADVLVALDAASLMDDPGPAAFEGWVTEAVDRAELALLTAPDGELRDVHVSLHSTLEEFRDLAAANDFDSSAPDPDGAADALAAELDGLAVELRMQIDAGGCEIDPRDTTEAEALAAELEALDAIAPPTTSSGPTTSIPADVDVNHLGSRIAVSVPAEWSGESGGVAATPFGQTTRFLVRAPDPAVFDEVRVDGAGMAIYALDDTVDFNAMLAASGPARTCTLAGEAAYDDGVYVGVRREYTDCGGTPVAIVVVGAADNDAQVAAYVEIRATALDDRAIDVVLNSFYV